MERTKRKSSVYNDCVPYGGRVPNFKEKEGMKLKKADIQSLKLILLISQIWFIISMLK